MAPRGRGMEKREETVSGRGNRGKFMSWEKMGGGAHGVDTEGQALPIRLERSGEMGKD